MKKVLLMLVACIAAVNVSAQDVTGLMGWEKSFTPVADKDNLAGVHTAIASDGSIYVSSTYDQAIDFAGLSLAAPEENLLSSIIFKTNKDGVGQWAVTFFGACTINAMTVDTDGTLYVAGRITDEKVELTGTDGNKKTISNPMIDQDGDMVIGCYSAFVVKINSNGVIQAVKTISSSTNEEITTTMEDAFYWAEETIGVSPQNIVVDGNKVYVCATYMGDVTELGWNGVYVNSWGMLADVYAAGVFSLDKSNLSSAQNVACVRAINNVDKGGEATTANKLAEALFGPDALNFMVKDGVVYVAFFGSGELALITPTTTKTFADDPLIYNSETGIEHALFLAKIDNNVSCKVLHSTAHTNEALRLYNITSGEVLNDNVYFGGTFYKYFPWDESIVKEGQTSFVASIKASDCSKNWAMANEVESEAKCMVVTGEEIHAATADALYTFRTSNGELKATDTQHGYEDADAYKDECVSTVYTKDNAVWINVPYMNPSGINETKALKNGTAKYYNLNGVELSSPQKGLNIIKTTDGVKKVTVK